MTKIMELAEAYRASHRCIADFAETNGDKERAALQAEVTRMEAEVAETHQLKMRIKHLRMSLDEKTALAEGYGAKLAALEAQEPVGTVLQSATNYDGTWRFFCNSTQYLATGVTIYLAAGAKP